MRGSAAACPFHFCHVAIPVSLTYLHHFFLQDGQWTDPRQAAAIRAEAARRLEASRAEHRPFPARAASATSGPAARIQRAARFAAGAASAGASRAAGLGPGLEQEEGDGVVSAGDSAGEETGAGRDGGAGGIEQPASRRARKKVRRRKWRPARGLFGSLGLATPAVALDKHKVLKQAFSRKGLLD